MKPDCIRDISKFSSMDSNRLIFWIQIFYTGTAILIMHCLTVIKFVDSPKSI